MSQVPKSAFLTFPLVETPGAILFDCDGTLVDTMPLHYKAWHMMLDAHGFEDIFPVEEFYAFAGTPAREVLDHLAENHAGLRAFDLNLLTDEKEMSYHALVPSVTELPEIVAEARRFYGKIPMGVVSGGLGMVVRESLRITGIIDLFDVIIGSEDVTHGKPHPEPFLLGAERLGVAPERCVVFEDGVNGFISAHAAGMKVVDVTRWITQTQA